MEEQQESGLPIPDSIEEQISSLNRVTSVVPQASDYFLWTDRGSPDTVNGRGEPPATFTSTGSVPFTVRFDTSWGALPRTQDYYEGMGVVFTNSDIPTFEPEEERFNFLDNLILTKE